jgi:hypothetical protein
VIFKEISDRKGEGKTLNNIGDILELLDNIQKL